MNAYTGASAIDMRALRAGMIMLTIAPILIIYPLILKHSPKAP
jgi:putative aldouronate transport system permease protein